MNLFFLPLKSLTLASLFNLYFKAHTSHLKLTICSDVLSFIIQIVLWTIFSLIWGLHFISCNTQVIRFLLMTLFQRELFIFTIQTTITCCWGKRQLLLSLKILQNAKKNKEENLPTAIAAWVSTCKIPAQSTLDNLAYCFLPAEYSFSSPTLQIPEDRFHNPEATDFLTLDTRYRLKAMLWQVIFVYPFNLERQRKYRVKAWE